jgi:hypothetical protein
MVYFKKSQPAPNISRNYNTLEVLQRLEQDFKNKCYICEQKEATNINIEHFVAHQGDDSLKYDWNNLFLSCSHCNNIKLNNYNNLLNCTISTDEVDIALHYYCKPMPKEYAVFNIEIPSNEATKTKDLLDKCFNGEHTPQKKLESSNLRSMLLEEIRKFQELLFDYEEDENDSYLIKIKYELSNKSAFTAFKRWMIRDNNYLKNKFIQYIED